MEILRCCTPKYKVNEYTEAIPSVARDRWAATPHSHRFGEGDTVVNICHNCSAVIEEQWPEVKRLSLWELILSDDQFQYPDYHGEAMTLQDCWRSYDHGEEQEAVRQLLRKMNISIVELPENRAATRFCGTSLYRPAPPRNLKLAPHRFVDHAEGLFVPHTPQEQQQLMRDHCLQITTPKVVTYCHYCSEGIQLGGKTEMHLVSLLFGGGYHYV